ncbi:MAG: hypothetical protein KA248_03575 [Kiritimatiellae bacterium]|nr:hypothetical protein [Kiritimatiellia bacterium]
MDARRLFRSIAAAGAAAAIGLLLPACAPSPRAGHAAPPPRHKTWWNFYQRGTALSYAGDDAAAAQQFRICLGLERGAVYGYPRDTWRARTYGFHFIDDYFPHRELGICFFRLGEASNAVRFLEHSLEQQPSGRARHFLNLARAELVRGRAQPPPRIDLAPPPPAWSRERTLTVAGRVSAEGYVQAVTVNGRPLFLELAAPVVPISRAVELAEGENIVLVAARDLADRETSARWSVTADWQPPGLAILKADRQADGWAVEARAVDRFGLAQVSVDGRPLEPGHGKAADFKILVPFGGTRAVHLADFAGNTLDRLLEADRFAEVARDRAPRYAARAAEGRADVPERAAPESGDRLRPSLRLHTPLRTRVFNREFHLEGTTSDGGGLTSLSINGEELLPEASRGCVQFHFARRLALDPGTNVFEVVAVDRAGHRNREQCVVIGQDPEYLDEAYRLSLGVSPVSTAAAAEPVVDARAEQVGRLMEHELLLHPPRFRVLERADGWGALIEEQRLSASDLADPRAALRIGKLVPAELLALTLLIPQGESLTIFSRVVDSASGEILCAEDVYVPAPEKDLRDRVEGLAMKIEQQFPLMDGKILSASSDIATVGIGAAQGLKPGMRFLVLDGPGEGRGGLAECTVRLHAEKAVELCISRVYAQRAQAKVSPPAAAAGLAEGDVIYAR